MSTKRPKKYRIKYRIQLEGDRNADWIKYAHDGETRQKDIDAGREALRAYQKDQKDADKP